MVVMSWIASIAIVQVETSIDEGLTGIYQESTRTGGLGREEFLHKYDRLMISTREVKTRTSLHTRGDTCSLMATNYTEMNIHMHHEWTNAR